MGLERRDAALPEADDGVRTSRPAPLVAAALPALERAEQEDGHLLPRDAASERDYRDQAGVLADAAPDLILVEGQRQDEEARVAMAIAAEAGLPVWISLETECLAGVDLEEWLDYARSSGVSRVLVPPPLAERDAAIDGAMAWGGVRIAPDAVAEWLAAGAGVIGRLDGATVAQLEPLRAAIDAHEGEVVAQVRATEQRLSAAVADAAAMAPGGTAVWIGQRTSDALPSHFAWLTVVEDEIRQLPDGHFRLVAQLIYTRIN
jgi:hypothetical protein